MPRRTTEDSGGHVQPEESWPVLSIQGANNRPCSSRHTPPHLQNMNKLCLTQARTTIPMSCLSSTTS